MSEPERFFFMHLQKTAGTALWRRLQAQFAADALYPGPGDGNPPETVLSIPHLLERWSVRRDDIRIVTGHFPLCAAELLDAPVRTITLMREPVERTLSFLRHHRETTPEDAERPLEEIYEDPIRFELLHNHMVKMLSLSVDEMTDGALTPVTFDHARFIRARLALDELEVVGFQEDFEAFCAGLTQRFGWDLGDPVFMNRSQPIRVADAFRDRIARDNALDVELFAYARSVRTRETRSGRRRAKGASAATWE